MPKTFTSPAELSKRIPIAEKTWAHMRCRGDGPPYVKIGGRVFYDNAEVDQWFEARKVNSTSEAAA